MKLQFRISRRPLLWLGGAFGLSAILGGEALAKDAPVKRFLGSYRFTGGKAERDARDKAIEDAIAGLGLFRGLARDALRAANEIPSDLGIKSEKKGASLTITADKDSFSAPSDGTPVKVKVVTGDVMEMHYDVIEGQLDQIFDGGDRGRLNRYTFAKDKLIMNVKIHAQQLPKDVIYKLTFERA